MEEVSRVAKGAWRLKDVFGDIFPLPLGADCELRLEHFCKEPEALRQNAELPFNASNQAEGRISMRVFTSVRNSGEGGIGAVYYVLEEVSGVGQGFINFRQSERSEESQVTSLRGGFCKIPSLPSILRNLNKTPLPNPLPWRGNQVTSPLPLGEGRILNELASCKNSGEGCYARSPADKYW